MDAIEELLTRGVDHIYPTKEELEKVLRSGKKLRLYQGFDPSMPSLHLGNFVGLMKLRQFQRQGHKVIFLVGDFTGMIGDPTDKLATRKKLTREEVEYNCKNWKKQASSILDFEGSNPVEIMFNSAWLDKISFRNLIEITSNFTVGQMLERDMFQKRLAEDKPIHLHEFLYPIAVSIDCVEMDVDLEIGGSDQTFNMLAGRHLMRAVKNKEKFVLTTKLLVDKEGNKVGKTTGNALFLDSTPEQFFGGIMSFPDEVIKLAFELLTECNLDGIEEKINRNPMEEKKVLASEIVKLIWGNQASQKAREFFENTFQKKSLPQDIPQISISGKNLINLVELLATTKLVSSKSQAKRLILEKAVEIDGKTLTDPKSNIQITNGMIIRVGKHRFVKIKL